MLEIGIGSGQATSPILNKNCNFVAIEYGNNFTNLCRAKFKDYKNFTILTGKFEDIYLEAETYDLIFSATAFHWIPEETGYSKFYSLLQYGGAFA